MARLKALPWHGAAHATIGQLLARQVHAVLLHGAAGIGKLDLALDWAESLLCEQRLADVQAGKHPPRKGGKVLRNYYGDVVECADENRWPTRIVDVNVNDVWPKPLVDDTSKCTPNGPQVDEVGRVWDT